MAYVAKLQFAIKYTKKNLHTKHSLPQSVYLNNFNLKYLLCSNINAIYRIESIIFVDDISIFLSTFVYANCHHNASLRLYPTLRYNNISPPTICIFIYIQLAFIYSIKKKKHFFSDVGFIKICAPFAVFFSVEITLYGPI